MRSLFLITVFALLCSTRICGQCDVEPGLNTVGKAVLKKSFRVDNATDELVLTLSASSPNTSWEKKGAEAAVLTVFVDGKYNQDVILFAGAEVSSYRILLGKWPPGNHSLSVALNKARSSPIVERVEIASVKIESASVNGDDKIGIANAPMLYLRPDTIDKFSDIPLIVYYEIVSNAGKPLKITYTSMFTNEDGGTQTAILMARWGRVTDIEWVYELEQSGKTIVSETIQAANHLTKPFAGKRIFGSHPQIYVASDNNNFADSGCSKLRSMLVPIRAELSKRSRETMMDENPWTYKIMAREAAREGKIEPDKTGYDVIADPRDYIYADIYNEPQNAMIAIERDGGDGKIVSSDNGNILWRVERSGFFRIALRMPKENRGKFPLFLTIGCYSILNGTATCNNLNLQKAVRLDENYFPHELKLTQKPQNLKAGEKAVFNIR